MSAILGFLPPLPPKKSRHLFPTGINPMSRTRGIVQHRLQPATATLIFAGIGPGRLRFSNCAVICLVSGVVLSHVVHSVQEWMDEMPFVGIGLMKIANFFMSSFFLVSSKPERDNWLPGVKRICSMLKSLQMVRRDSRSLMLRVGSWRLGIGVKRVVFMID